MHCLQCFGVALGQPLTPLRLSIQPLVNRSVRVAWPNSAAGFMLEEASAANSTLWQAVGRTPIEQNNQFAVTVDASAGNRFFRLRLPLFTTIEETSPANGETGVAVIRETIVRFTAPLATNAVVGTNNFYAGFGGRRLLSRVELSSDRTKATLFYLEPLPGSTRVVAVFDGTALTDFLGRPLDADGDGQPGGSEVIAFDTLSLTPLTGTAVVGRVFASELMPGADTGTNAVNRPLESVTITVDGREQELRTRTDAMGNFTLTPVPPGRFFVKIDGRTAKGSVYPSGAYYPYVGKAWDAVAGRTNNLAGGTGDIFLPLITAGTLQPVSVTQDTTVAFPADVIANNPALAGVSITVPANSLFSDDGTRGGKVGIAPVPPDRLPGPLPPGLEMPIVITVQTDGPLNFDKPAPVCFPNLPDPVTKQPLPPGSQQALISFNHKKGIWEAVGSMTVSADGKFICTDPGVGILQPGWHGVGPKPDEPLPDCKTCCPIGGGTQAFLASASPQGVVKTGPGCAPCNGTKGASECAALCDKKAKEAKEKYKEWNTEDALVCQRFQSFRGPYDEITKFCWAKHRQESIDKAQKILRDFADCLEGCRDCPLILQGRLSGSNIALQDRLANLQRLTVAKDVDSETDFIIQQIDALIEPYAARGDALPAVVADQIATLFRQADGLVGGDLVRYLDDQIVELERELADLGNDSGPAAPPYPVLYVAVVLRSGNPFYLRGETQPFGQYSLFIPRDGKLLDVQFYDPRAKTYGTIFPNRRPEAPYALPRFTLVPLPLTAADSDHDGLPDLVEFVYGTDPAKPDTDGDGVSDGAEVENGTNPLDGLPTQTGIIATAKTPGLAVDVCVGNDLIVTAEGAAGVSIFNAYNGDNPTIIAHVPTPGNAQRVAVGGNFVAVAQPDFGLSIIDVSTPASARIVQQFRLMGAEAVVAGGSTAYVGGGGVIVAVDLGTGLVNPLYLTNTVRDLALNGNYLYALTDDRLLAISVTDGAFTSAGSVPSPFFAKPNRRLFAGGGIAYAVHTEGYNTFDLRDPSNPALIKSGVTTLYGWKQLVSNGSGLGLAAVGPNSAFDFAQDISLYDLSSPTNTDVFVTKFSTPGAAESVAIWNGLAYAADSDAGLQVINYLAYDSKGVPPQITLVPGFDTNGVQAGTHVSINANATDDVQVRNVEFYIDGTNVFSDGNFPFEYRFVIPALSTAKTNFSLQARAIDTGGNATWSDVITVKLLPDTTASKPPTVNFTTPVGGGARTLTTLLAYFSKPIDPVTLTSASFQLFAAGPDGSMGTADDVPVTGGVVSYTSFGYVSALTFAAPLPVSRYRAVITTAVADLAGNQLAADHAWDFQVADATFWVNFGDGPWDVASNWDTDVVPTKSDNVIINFPVTVTLTKTITLGKTVSGVAGSKLHVAYFTSATFDGLTLNADLLLDPNVAVSVINGLTLNGVVTMPGGQNYTQLIFDGTQTLDGTGQIVLADLNSQTTRVEPINGTLTIGPDLTIRGSGVVGNPTLPLVNLGTIVADTSAPGSSLTVTGSSVESRGTLSSRNGGLLILQNVQNHGVVDLPNGSVNLTGTFKGSEIGTITGSGGTINVLGTLDNRTNTLTLDATSGSWQLAGGTILGGVVKATGGAQFVVARGTLDGVRMDADVHMIAGAILGVLNGLTLNGMVTMDAAGGNYTQMNFDGTQALDGTGQIVLASFILTLVEPINGTLTIGPNLTIRGSGVVGSPSLPLVNLGTIVADTPGSSMTVTGSSVENRGTLSSRNGGILIVQNLQNHGVINLPSGSVNLTGTFKGSEIGTITGSGGTINVLGTLDNRNNTLTLDATSGSWQLAGGTIQGGTLKGAAGVALTVPSPYPTLDGVILDIDLTLNAGVDVRVTNGLTLNRTATLNGGLDGTTLNFDGTQTLDGTGQLIFVGPPNTVVQPLNGALTIGPGLTIRGGSGTVGNPTLPLINQGTITAEGAGSILHILGSPFTNTGSTNEVNGGKIVLGP